MQPPDIKPGALCPTGIAGLDDILGGGLPANRFYLVQGNPGVGKTTLALQFLRDGVRRGERVLYITLSETREEMLAVLETGAHYGQGYFLARPDRTLPIVEWHKLGL